MKTPVIKHLVCIFALLLSTPGIAAQVNADSLMRTLWKQTENYGKRIQHYEARLYMKRYVKKNKKNVLIDLVPQMMSFEKGTNEYVSESLSELSFTAPNIYDRHLIAAYGTIPNLKQTSDMVMDYFTLDIYKEKMISDHLLSPFIYENASYYLYRVESINNREAVIAFYPLYNNTHLIKGRFVMDLDKQLVKNTQFEGKYEFMKFEVNLTMGHSGLEVYLPESSELNFKFSFIGNKLEGHYKAKYLYTQISQQYKNRNAKRRKHDLTDQYALSLDTTKYQFDSLLVARNRFFPLTEHEQELYRRYAIRIDSLEQRRVYLGDETHTKLINWGNIGKSMVASSEINAPLFGKIKTSPLLAPMLFNYSKTRGFDWRQELKIQRDYKRSALSVAPLIGYNFTYKEIDWRLKVGYDFWKPLQAHFELEVGNGFRTYSSDLADILSNVKAKDVEDLQLAYYNDEHVKVNQRFELFNGFELTLGAVWYNRHLAKKAGMDETYMEILGDIQDHYTTFAPRVRVDLTPGKYYYWDRNRKKTVYTPIPTFSFDWEKGIDGLLGSEGTYERYEVEISHEREYRVQDRFSYRLGYGKFIDQPNVYFVDFNNFSHNRLPDGWNEEIGGTFQLLDYRWYSSASEYLRGHFTYESPNLFLTKTFKNAAHAIQGERIYVNGLLMHHLTPYIELGYGFATHIFDFGIFASLRTSKINSFGVKFSFELFKK